jgi:hypothetical protein
MEDRRIIIHNLIDDFAGNGKGLRVISEERVKEKLADRIVPHPSHF